MGEQQMTSKKQDDDSQESNEQEEQDAASDNANGVKKKLKNMSPEELKAYKSENKRKNRLKMKEESGRMNIGSSSKSLKTMTADELNDYKKNSKKKIRQKMTDLSESNSQTPIKDMSPTELKSYNAEKKRLNRLKQKSSQSSLQSQSSSQMSDTQSTVGDRKRKNPLSSQEWEPSPKWSTEDTQQYEQVSRIYRTRARKTLIPDSMETVIEEEPLESISMDSNTDSEDLPEKKFHCKIRFGLVDILQVETQCIVIPLRGAVDQTNRNLIYNQLMRHTNEKDVYQDFLDDNCEDLKEDAIEHFDDIRFDTVRTCMHIQEPVVIKNKYTIVTEAQLRSAYFRCMREADNGLRESIAFPILGQGVHRLKAVAIAIQTMYAYFQVSKQSNLKLVYLVTKNVDHYDEIGAAMSYIREIDLSIWKRKHYFEFEKMLFDKIKPKNILSTIPGTDMVWRSFKYSFEIRKKKQQKEQLRNIQIGLSKLTGVIVEFEVLEGSDVSPRMPKKYISEVQLTEVEARPLIKTSFPVENVCGSNAMLRKLWVISYYYMYYSDGFNDTFDFSNDSVEGKGRKELFDRLKHVHREVLLQWKRIRRNVSVKCHCSKPDGRHECLSIFSTPLSYPDVIFDNWILFEKELILGGNDVLKEQDVAIQTSPLGNPIALDQRKKIVMSTFEDYEDLMRERVLEWFQNVKEYSRNQTHNFQAVLEYLDLNDFTYMTGDEESQNQNLNIEEFDDELDRGNLTDDQEERDALNEARMHHSMAQGLEEIGKAAEMVRECLKDVAFKRFLEHATNECKLEQVVRNRAYRKYTSSMDEHSRKLWRTDDQQLCTVEQYIAAELQDLGMRVETPVHVDTTLDDTFLDSEYPDAVDIGDRTVKCYNCNSNGFPIERLRSCCKNGKVWINPEKMLPKIFDPLFMKKNQRYIIAINSNFSMASVHYDRRKQKAHGVQSFKVDGVVSFHPSAIHPHDNAPPRYANFIVLQHGNEEVVSMRMEAMHLLPAEHQGLKNHLVEIQKYLDENNALYKCYKNMAELEKKIEEEHMDAPDDNINIKFRIVSPTEMQRQDLEFHKGVYAMPARIGKDYISVAYTHNPQDPSELPRGLRIYPKNPATPQESISIFSDLCDTMSYPLFYPEGRGGYGLHKYPRWTSKGPPPSFETRIRDHILELIQNGEDPKEYYVLEDGKMEEILKNEGELVMMDQEMMSENGSDCSINDENEHEDSDNEDDVERNQKELDEDLEDPENWSDDRILEYDNLEDGQEGPLDFDTAQQPNIIMVERGGEVYPVLEKNQNMLDIPLVSGNPFGDDEQNVDGDDLPDLDRYNKKDPNSEIQVEDEWNDVDALDMEKINMDSEVVEQNDPDEEEDEPEEVCFGDEYAAESTAVGRNNDGVKVQNVGQRKYVSMAEYANFIMQDRDEIPCRFLGKARNLGQLHIIDYACRIIESRLTALIEKRAEFPRTANRGSLFKFYEHMVNKQFKGKKKVGMVSTLGANTPGSPKYMRELVMNTVTMANVLGAPTLFITFTANPQWPEIQRECKRRGCTWADIPDFVVKVFYAKLEMFVDDVAGKKKKQSTKQGRTEREPGIFGMAKWFAFSVEFQQRGMPHAHMMLSLENQITNAAQVDEIVTAEVPENPSTSDPNYEQKHRYYELVKNLMVHFPCEGDPSAYCQEGTKPHWKQCSKGFKKKLTDVTILADNQYPDYKRTPDHHFTLYRKGQAYKAGSEYVVAHNKYLLMKYESHINVEVVSSIRTMKYMYKYIFKGSDRVLLEACENMSAANQDPDAMTLQGNLLAPNRVAPGKILSRQRHADRLMDAAGVDIPKDQRLALNDCTYMMDMSAMTSCEAAWRIGGFPMHGSSHIIHRGFVHEENNERFFFKRGLSAAQAKSILKQKSRGMLNAWFEANQKPRKLPNGQTTADLTLPEMFLYYRFDTRQQKFIFRKRNYSHRIIGRIQAPQPRFLELTATRLLAQVVRGPKQFQDLRTYNGEVYQTCLEAARARRLMNGEQEWIDAIQEVGESETPADCRRFFVSILLHCAPANPKELFEISKEYLVDNKKHWSDNQKIAYALQHISILLKRHGADLHNYELLDLYNEHENELPVNPDDVVDHPNQRRQDLSYHEREGQRLYAQLNREQKAFVDRALELSKQKGGTRLLFVGGPGGTGKTYCYRCIYHLLKARKQNVCDTTHTGVAAHLLPEGCTAHRRFGIPLEVSEDMMCKICAHSPEADELRNLDCVIWDEISMTHRYIFQSVHRLFQDLHDSTDPFGGVLVIMGGDWRQILPIVEGVRGEGVVEHLFKFSHLWPLFEKFELTENRRAINDPEYSKMILDIGDGANYVHERRQMVSIPEQFVERGSEQDLVNWTFPDVNDVVATKTASVLTLDNKTALRLNERILDRLDGRVMEFISIDTPDKDNALSADPAIFATETPSGLPPHRLRLKVGAQIVLLRNLSVEEGLCNGTRLTVESFGNDIIFCTRNKDPSRGRVFLHRMIMSQTGKGAKNCGFHRRQFPVRLAYAQTVNKAQGQTLSRCGLILHSAVYSHGQAYVAFSRVAEGAHFKVWHYRRDNSDDHYVHGGILMRNVVYRDALRDN